MNQAIQLAASCMPTKRNADDRQRRIRSSGAKADRRPKRIRKSKDPEPPKRPIGLPIVGVGASAGGLEAFTQLLQHLPADTGMAFVLVQHLDPARQSALSEILSRATSLPVTEVTSDQPVEPNHIYVIPPNADLTVVDAILKLQPRQRGGPHRSIDSFLESLAQDQRERAIGVILSGTATDGTLGLEAIKAEGGITFAQDETAKYDSMPRSAIAAGCVDFVLRPEDIASELARIAKHPVVAGQFAERFTPSEDDRMSATVHEDDESPLPSGGHGSTGDEARQARAEGDTAQGRTTDSGFKKILLLLRNHSGVDFSLYKSSTIQRRIARRMVLIKRDSLEDYARFLRGNAKELDALYSDVLISVTSFFRNPEAFDLLKRKVFPKLLQRRGDEPFRAWVLGCSTGQEAYSIAMTFVEAAEKAPRLRKLQVFATDLNEALLDKARHGLYSKSLAQDVSPERLRQFFVEEEGGYRVVKSLREMVVFARQNLISDPPFSRMDLVSCRNLMIYLEPNLQRKLLPTFHYALKPDGFLFLGASESIGGFTDLFAPADKKNKIYSKKAAQTPAFHLPVRRERGDHPAVARPGRVLQAPKGTGQGDPAGFRGELNSQREADRVTINRYSPPGVLVNAELQILQFRGPTGGYLEPPTGKASFDVLKMARQGLMLPLRATINKARKENKPARRENIRVAQNGSMRAVNIEVIPLRNLRERCYLILFEDVDRMPLASGGPREDQPGGPTKTSRAVSQKEDSRRSVELERELAEMRDYLQSVLEQHDAANEELQASNEEVQSANEELQSINEELETSKEELESANEELTTVNEEMANRNSELSRLNSDLTNLQTSTKLAILLLGRDLTIRRFSAQAEKQFNLLATDIGRPISRIRHNLDLADLEEMVKEVVDSVHEAEREVRDADGHWYSLRVRPYLTLDNKVDGAVLVLVNIDDLKRVERVTIEGRDYAEAIIRTVPDPLVVLTGDLLVQSVNETFCHTFKVSASEMEGRSIFSFDRGSWNIPGLRQRLEDILPRDSAFNDLQITHDFEKIGRRTMLLNARTLLQAEGKTKLMLLGIRDITEVLVFQAELRRAELRFRRLFEAAHDGVLMLDVGSGKITDANQSIVNFLGYAREELVGRELWEFGLVKDEQAARAAFRELQRTGEIRYDNLPLQAKSGEQREVEVVASRHDEGGISIIQCNVRDVTERKSATEALRESEARFRTLAESAPGLIWINDLSGCEYVNSQYLGFLGVSIADVRGYDWAQFIHSDDRDSYVGAYMQAMDQRAVFEAVFRFRRRDGEYRWMRSVGQPRIGTNGDLLGYAGLTVDITEERQAAEELRQSHEKLRSYAEDLARFNRVAVGRETRMIELKKEINELCQRLGEAMRYPLDFEEEGDANA